MKETKPTLASIEAELARQDEQLEAFEEAITALGDVQLAVPDDFFDEIDALATPQISSDPRTINLSLLGLRA